MKSEVKKLLDLAVNAPSGHNSQPWRFEVKENTIKVYLVEKDKTLFNWKQRGSLIAHGCLVENIVIISSKIGYQANVNLFPETNNFYLTAEIRLEKSQKHYDYEHLYPYITERTTNRKPFRRAPLNTTDKDKLNRFFTTTNMNEEFDVSLIESQDKIKLLAQAFSMGDRLIFENRLVHKALFDNVSWTLEEERRKKEGLYIGTKELSFINKIIFRYILSRWRIIMKLTNVGISTKAARKRAQLYEKCSAIGLITASNDSIKSFIEAGRVLERLWLTTTSLGLSFQPVSVGLLYLGQRCKNENPNELTSMQDKIITQAYNKVCEIFKINDNSTPTFSFRIGYSSPPSASSLKKEAEIKYLS